MCGVFGLVLRPGATIARNQVRALVDALFRLSESRGKESAGLHVSFPGSRGWTLRGAVAATEFLVAPAYRDTMARALELAYPGGAEAAQSPVLMLGHSRLVTNGAAEREENNQPVRREHVTVVHNGIVVNVDELWRKNPDLRRTAEVDTEIIAALLGRDLARGRNHCLSTRSAYAQIRGSASIAWCHDGSGALVLATNTGDLYLMVDTRSGFAVFASERYILRETLAKTGLGRGLDLAWVTPATGVVLDPADLQAKTFALQDGHVACSAPAAGDYAHSDVSIGPAQAPAIQVRHADETLLRYNESRLRALRRCTRCILPETFPFIGFDDLGVCNYCRGYVARYQGIDAAASKQRIVETLRQRRSGDGTPDVLVAFSDGRDSSYGLHLIKREIGLTPITFTYDWGMVTDLARRNIARVCGQLGIPNILVSADIRAKRSNIRKNVAAWLNKPDLGLIPLFMAGDKHFFRVVNQLKRQTGIELDVWCANPLENTDFKAGLCGVSPDFHKKAIDHLSFSRKLSMAAYYARAFACNPGLLNSSLIDTVNAFWSYYYEPRRGMTLLFDHIVWNEEEVNRVLLNEYDWERAEDTASTWRIGDATAPFYNYVYVTAGGFSEFDTFRSNQIREGDISREEALASVLVENRPRFKSIRWYLDTIGLPFDEAIRAINRLDVRNLHASHA